MADIDWKTELKSRSDIVSVVSGYVTLVKKGKNFWGRCPFHSERTPSFAVSPDVQLYKCYGCGVGGDVIKFVMEMENMPFMDACQLLAKRFGYKMPETDANSAEVKEARRKDRLYTLTETLNQHYERNLRTSDAEQALAYLHGRGLTDEIIARFRLGYCNGGQDSVRYLTSKGYSISEINDCGLLARREDHSGAFEGYYDMMYGRITFPIINQYGNIVAFGGRFVGKTDFAKYKNTANQSVIFTKGNTLYGIHLINALRKQKQLNDGVIVVEGYMDVIGLSRFGILNAVATMGTAMTEKQALQISRYTDKVYLCYDGDSAGQHAADRGSVILYNKGLNVSVVTLKDGLDPDEYVGQYGIDAFMQELAAAKPLFVYLITKLAAKYDLTTFEGRGAFASAALNELRIIDDPLKATSYLELISEYSQHSLSELQEVFNGKLNQAKLYEEKKNVVKSKDTLYDKSLCFVLYALMEKRPYVDATVDISEYVDALYLPLYTRAREAMLRGEDVSAGEYHQLLDEDAIMRIVSLSEPIGITVNNEAQYYLDCLKTVQRIKVNELITETMQQLNATADAGEKTALVEKLTRLTAIKRRLGRG